MGILDYIFGGRKRAEAAEAARMRLIADAAASKVLNRKTVSPVAPTRKAAPASVRVPYDDPTIQNRRREEDWAPPYAPIYGLTALDAVTRTVEDCTPSRSSDDDRSSSHSSSSDSYSSSSSYDSGSSSSYDSGSSSSSDSGGGGSCD